MATMNEYSLIYKLMVDLTDRYEDRGKLDAIVRYVKGSSYLDRDIILTIAGVEKEDDKNADTSEE